jgi:NADP-dependent 3-hydroxy acid dehydrogenase YdfG
LGQKKDMQMAAKVHLITGAGSGIGQLTAQRALAGGWKVAALDLNAEGLNNLGEYESLLKLPTDVTDFAAVQAAVLRATSSFGPIDRVTNAAAIMPLGLLVEQPREVILKIMDINFGGLVNVSKATLPGMLQRRSGEFVSYSSMAGHWPILYMGAYNASKHAVAAYTEVLYHEVRGSGVRVLCVCPPIVATPLLNQARETAWPKIFDLGPPATPELVVDAVERALKSKKLWVFPGVMTGMSYRFRRWLPGLMWRIVHLIERR